MKTLLKHNIAQWLSSLYKKRVRRLELIIGAIISFLISLGWLVVSLGIDLIYLNYFFLYFSIGILALSSRWSILELYTDKGAFIKSKIVKYYIFALLILIDCALIYVLYFTELTSTFTEIVENDKFKWEDICGINVFTITSWILIIWFLKRDE
jgi:hypothetical protein